MFTIDHKGEVTCGILFCCVNKRVYRVCVCVCVKMDLP